MMMVKEQVRFEINKDFVLRGEAIFKEKCKECHKLELNYIGPDLKDVIKKRKAEWI